MNVLQRDGEGEGDRERERKREGERGREGEREGGSVQDWVYQRATLAARVTASHSSLSGLPPFFHVYRKTPALPRRRRERWRERAREGLREMERGERN